MTARMAKGDTGHKEKRGRKVANFGGGGSVGGPLEEGEVRAFDRIGEHQAKIAGGDGLFDRHG